MTTLALDSRTLADGTVIVTDSSDADNRYVVWQDDAPECPNEWGTGMAYRYRVSSRSNLDDAECELSEVFYRAYASTGDDARALEVARRYARVIMGKTAEWARDNIVTYSARGYSQGDWWDILAITDDGYAEAHAQTWEQWARGDVLAVMRETRIECEHAEHCHGDDDAHWEAGDTLSGIYADSAEEAVAHALGNGLA